MAELPSPEELSGLAGLLTPGIVILWVRSRFRDTTTQPIADKLLAYAVISVVYGGALFPVFHDKTGIALPAYLWQVLLNIITPLLVAFSLVMFDRSEWFYKASKKFGLRPVHHIQTAWDYTFPHRPPSYVIVHLSDDSTVAGAWTSGSFASSVTGERDLLISELWKLEGETWTKVEPARSMLISGGSIRMVEFITGG